jgi:hypothetical protein
LGDYAYYIEFGRSLEGLIVQNKYYTSSMLKSFLRKQDYHAGFFMYGGQAIMNTASDWVQAAVYLHFSI